MARSGKLTHRDSFQTTSSCSDNAKQDLSEVKLSSALHYDLSTQTRSSSHLCSRLARLIYKYLFHMSLFKKQQKQQKLKTFKCCPPEAIVCAQDWGSMSRWWSHWTTVEVQWWSQWTTGHDLDALWIVPPWAALHREIPEAKTLPNILEIIFLITTFILIGLVDWIPDSLTPLKSTKVVQNHKGRNISNETIIFQICQSHTFEISTNNGQMVWEVNLFQDLEITT